MRKEKGFTLVELLVVMAIIGILIGLAIGGLNIARRNARDTTRKADLQNVRILIEDFYLSNKHYPTPDKFDAESATGQVTLTDDNSKKKSLTLEFGGTFDPVVSDGACGTNGADLEGNKTVDRDKFTFCYDAKAGRPQSYQLCALLESGDVFCITTEEEE